MFHIIINKEYVFSVYETKKKAAMTRVAKMNASSSFGSYNIENLRQEIRHFS